MVAVDCGGGGWVGVLGGIWRVMSKRIYSRDGCRGTRAQMVGFSTLPCPFLKLFVALFFLI